MLLTAPVKEKRRIPESAEQARLFGLERLNKPRSDIPAVTHVDYSAAFKPSGGRTTRFSMIC